MSDTPKRPRKVHWDEVWNIAKAHHLEDPLESIPAFRRFLIWWWCRKYNRPLKDPLLAQYTLNELIYEFIRHFYAEPDNDPRKELQEKAVQSDDDEWVRKMLEQAKKAQEMAEQAQTLAEQIQDAEKKKESQPVDDLPEAPEFSTKFED